MQVLCFESDCSFWIIHYVQFPCICGHFWGFGSSALGVPLPFLPLPVRVKSLLPPQSSSLLDLLRTNEINGRWTPITVVGARKQRNVLKVDNSAKIMHPIIQEKEGHSHLNTVDSYSKRNQRGNWVTLYRYASCLRRASCLLRSPWCLSSTSGIRCTRMMCVTLLREEIMARYQERLKSCDSLCAEIKHGKTIIGDWRVRCDGEEKTQGGSRPEQRDTMTKQPKRLKTCGSPCRCRPASFVHASVG